MPPEPDYDALEFGMLSDADLAQMLQDALRLRERGLVAAVRRELARRRGDAPPVTPPGQSQGPAPPHDCA